MRNYDEEFVDNDGRQYFYGFVSILFEVRTERAASHQIGNILNLQIIDMSLHFV